MALFDVYEEEPRLCLAKCRMHTLRLVTVCSGFLFPSTIASAYVALTMRNPAEKPFLWFICVVCAISLYILFALQIPKILHGETWVFDAERRVLTFNNKLIVELKDIRSLTATRNLDPESGYGASLILHIYDRPPVRLSETMNPKYWDEYLRIGQGVAAVTGVIFVVNVLEDLNSVQKV